jgi:hypothetical protein
VVVVCSPELDFQSNVGLAINGALLPSSFDFAFDLELNDRCRILIPGPAFDLIADRHSGTLDKGPTRFSVRPTGFSAMTSWSIRLTSRIVTYSRLINLPGRWRSSTSIDVSEPFSCPQRRRVHFVAKGGGLALPSTPCPRIPAKDRFASSDHRRPSLSASAGTHARWIALDGAYNARFEIHPGGRLRAALRAVELSGVQRRDVLGERR